MPSDEPTGTCPCCEQHILDPDTDYCDGDELACPLCSADLVAWVEDDGVFFEQIDQEEEC